METRYIMGSPYSEYYVCYEVHEILGTLDLILDGFYIILPTDVQSVELLLVDAAYRFLHGSELLQD